MAAALPDAMLATASADPATIVAARGSLRLALVAALQHLPARQRAVLILRDVLALPAAEVAEMLGTTVPAVKSALQRARAQVEHLAPAEDAVSEPVDQRALLDRFVDAFENADVDALLRLLTADAVVEMPPRPAWFTGRDDIRRFFASWVFRHGSYRTVPTGANGQPAFGLYRRGDGGLHHAIGVMVLTVTAKGITRITAFRDPILLDSFGLPATRAAAPAAGRRDRSGADRAPGSLQAGRIGP